MASLDKRGSNKKLLKTLLQVLIDKNRFQESEADNVTQQYLKYIDEVVAEQQSRFTSFTLVENVDVLFHEAMAGNGEQSIFFYWKVTRFIISFSCYKYSASAISLPL
jgi:hypothetical protein